MKNFIKMAVLVIGIISLFVGYVDGAIMASFVMPIDFVAQRKLFKEIQSMYPRKTIEMNYLVRSQAIIAASKTSYDFNITKAQATSETYAGSENYLQNNDRLVVTHIGFHIARHLTTKPAAQALHTYPSAHFTEVSVSTFVLDDLMVYWNSGFLLLNVDNQDVIPKWRLSQHFKVPVSQRGTVVSTGTTKVASPQTLSTNKIAYDSYQPNDGFVPVPEFFNLDGTAAYKTQIQVPNVTGLVPVNDGSNVNNLLTISFLGFRIIGGAGSRID